MLHEPIPENLVLVDQVAQHFASSLKPNPEYDRFAEALSSWVNFDRVSIDLLDKASNTYTVKYLSGLRQPSRHAGDCVPLDGSETQFVALNNRTFLTEDIRLTDPSDAAPADPMLLNLGLRSRILVPIAAGDGVIGVLSLHSCQPCAFGAREQSILERLASQLAAPLNNSISYENVEKEMEVVDEIAKIITTTLEIDQVYEKFAIEMKRLVNFDRIVISTLDHAAGTSTLKYLYGKQRQGGLIGTVTQLEGTQTQKVLMTGQTLLRSNISDAREFDLDEAYSEIGLHSSIVIPLKFQGRLIGTLSLRSRLVGAFAIREQAILERLANQIAPAVYNSQVYAEAKAEMELVDEVAKIVTSTLSIDEVYEQFAIEVKKLLDFDGISINIIDQNAQTYLHKYLWGAHPTGRKQGEIRPLEGSWIQQVMRTGKALIREDHSSSLRSGISVPLISKGLVFGSLFLRSGQVGCYGSKEQAILERLASQIAPAIQNGLLYERAQKDEQKYQSLMNQSPDFLFVSRTDDLRFIEVNDRACEYYGYSREEFLSMSILDVEAHPPTPGEARGLYDRFPIGHVLEVYGTNKRKDGSTFPVHVRFTKLDEMYALANVRDITQQKMAEDEYRRQAEENSTARLNTAVSLVREQELMDSRRRVMIMSEGLRRNIAQQLHGTVQNKLIVIQQMMGHLTEKLESESYREEFSKLDMILTDLIQNDVRGISQQLYPSTLRRGLIPAMFSLISRMEPVLNVERQFAENIRSRDAAERDFIPIASRLAAYRIAEDALTNVIKHSETQAVTIRLELLGEEQFRLTVRDEGVGFDSRLVSGFLGLSAMRDYAEVAGGRCEITSYPGRGTEVTALLPLRVES